MFFFLSLMAVSLPSFAEDSAKQLWTCGMHPQVALDHPGDCPICHMKLIPLKKSGDASKTGVVAVSPEARQASGIVSAPVEKGLAGKTVRAVGIVEFDETSIAEATTKYRAWVEKLNVDFTGREVHKGEVLLELYSPEVFNAQAEYLIAKKSGDPKLLESAKLKLALLDVPGSVIAELEKSGKPLRTVPLLAPRDGVVVEKSVAQGQMVEAGSKLYRIADLGTVWVAVQIYERDLPFVKLGQPAVVETSYFPGRRYHGAVAYVYPTVDDATRSGKARIELHNPGYALKPGMFATASLKDSGSKEGLLIPETSILRGGDLDMVFIDLGNGRYEPRSVKLGALVGKGSREVLDGLSEGELVVVSGQFLLDSEANLRAAYQRLKPNSMKAMEKPEEDAAPSGPVEYVCPMPEHMSVTYKEPGKCPLCGMTLVPFDASSEPAKQLDHYACPMHPEVSEPKPGKCPKCGMTLIPVYKGKEAPKADAALKPDHYECPMAADNYSSPNPGRCPKCGMTLVPVYKK